MSRPVTAVVLCTIPGCERSCPGLRPSTDPALAAMCDRHRAVIVQRQRRLGVAPPPIADLLRLTLAEPTCAWCGRRCTGRVRDEDGDVARALHLAARIAHAGGAP